MHTAERRKVFQIVGLITVGILDVYTWYALFKALKALLVWLGNL